MAADNTYIFGTSLKRAGRPDLALAASRWWAEYGIGPKSKYIAMRALAKRFVTSSGAISVPASTWVIDADQANGSGERPIGGEFVQAQPETMQSYNVNLVERGKVVSMDMMDPNVIALQAQGGEQLVEQVGTERSLNLLLQAIDVKAASKLCAASTPFSTADTSATAAKWSTASTSVRTQIHALKLLFDGDLENCILSFKALNYLEANTDFSGANATIFNAAGLGTLSPEMIRNVLGSFGVQNLYVGDTTIWTDFVVFTKGGDGISGPAGAVLCIKQEAGADENGISYASWWSDHGRIWNVVAYMACDVVVPIDNGARITDVY